MHISKDSVLVITTPVKPILQKLLEANKFLHLDKSPVSQIEKPVSYGRSNALFYFLLILLFLIALIRVLYKKYLANLFRVFFNTSLKQTQITDQLQQQEIPSIFTNLIFIVSSGCFAYLLLMKKAHLFQKINFKSLLLIVALVASIYLVKYLVLKFTGWITGYKTQANLYIFIVFLVNKILGLFLVPIVIIAAFADSFLASAFLTTGIIVVFLFLISRFLRSFSLLQAQVKVSRFHFLLYIFSAELLPLALLYKALNVYFNNILF